MSEERIGLVREPEDGVVRQEWGTVLGNAVRLGPDAAEAVVDALRVDHAGSFNLFYLLRKHYWTAEGAEHDEVADFLREAYGRMRDVNDEIAFRIVELGGVPPNTPPTIQEYAEVHLEAENLYDLRASLAGDLEAYATLVVGMRDHVDLVERLGDPGTAELLREQLERIEADARAVEQFLEDDTLVRGGERR